VENMGEDEALARRMQQHEDMNANNMLMAVIDNDSSRPIPLPRGHQLPRRHFLLIPAETARCRLVNITRAFQELRLGQVHTVGEFSNTENQKFWTVGWLPKQLESQSVRLEKAVRTAAAELPEGEPLFLVAQGYGAAVALTLLRRLLRPDAAKGKGKRTGKDAASLPLPPAVQRSLIIEAYPLYTHTRSNERVDCLQAFVQAFRRSDASSTSSTSSTFSTSSAPPASSSTAQEKAVRLLFLAGRTDAYLNRATGQGNNLWRKGEVTGAAALEAALALPPTEHAHAQGVQQVRIQVRETPSEEDDGGCGGQSTFKVQYQ
jgi:hypothetical protein